MSVEDEHLDILQNIEFAILQVYRHERDLIDFDVDEALDALIDDYKREAQQRSPKSNRLYERPERVYTAVKQMCEWRLGREEMESSSSGAPLGSPEAVTTEEMVACLKRIKKSVQLWTKEGGRQGYLHFIEQHVAP